MVELSAEQFAQRAFDLNLLDERQLQDVWGQIGSRQLSGEEFQQILLRRELLTNYQTERLLRGDRTGFFYGDYKVLYLIGTGTFARVYRASHKTTGDIVALKVLRRRFAEDPEQADRFQREGEMGATLRHPNIVPIMEVASEGAVHYIVMKFIEGRNLREFIKIRKKFDPAEATRLVVDVASGLSYAFERGICHRDLKMSNVLVSSRGQAMLVDFGLAAGDNSDDEANSPNPRTIDYAGLERATGVRKDDPRSDIYFLGCIFYHILTGKPPIYETRDRIQRLSKGRFEDVVPITTADPAIPRTITAVVNRAMELNPEVRYQSPGEMLSDLRSMMERLNEPSVSVTEEEVAASKSGITSASASGISSAPQRTLMFVESNVGLQDIIRGRLKSNGYRVLVTADPDRALARFADGTKAADCVIFSTGELGAPALEAFNRFGEGAHTAQVPAVLLLGEHHTEWKKKAKLNDHRVAISMPIKLRQVRELLARLVPLDGGPKKGK